MKLNRKYLNLKTLSWILVVAIWMIYFGAGLEQSTKKTILIVVNNAFDAIKSDGFITIATHYDCRADEALISIADTGSGISPEIIDKIFDPFFTTKPVDKGTGLGLSVTFGIIQEHEGSIYVKSEMGQGTRFQVKLPLKSVSGVMVLPTRA